MNYGQAIKQIRTEFLDQNQAEFSKNLGITQTYLSLVENGKRKPSTDLIEKVGEYSKIPVAGILLLCAEEKDIAPKKRESFKTMKPVIEELVKIFVG